MVLELLATVNINTVNTVFEQALQFLCFKNTIGIFFDSSFLQKIEENGV